MKRFALAFLLIIPACSRNVNEEVRFPQGRISVMSVGNNRQPFDSDDKIIFIATYDYDSHGKLVSSTTYNNPGADGEWRTPDDVAKSFVRSVYDASNGLETRAEYYKPGTNEMTGYFENVYGEDGRRRREISHPDAGSDRVWFNADDGIGGWSRFDYEDGRLTVAWFYDGAGADGKWFTTDDTLLSFTQYVYNDETDILEASVTFRGAGADGKYGTEDDPVSHYALYENYRP